MPFALRGLRRRTVEWVRRRIGDSGPYRRRLRRRLAAVDRLHVGCGDVWVPGWLNVGLLPWWRQPYGTLRIRDGAVVLSLDVTLGLPLDDGRLDQVYGSHFIEHLAFGDGLAFMKECHRAMRPGGLIRLSCPDLELWARKYVENDRAFLEAYESAVAGMRDLPELRTRGQIMMSQVHGWGHRWAYDAESLCEALERTGFRDATPRGYRESGIRQIGALEPDTPVRLLETLYVEAFRA